MGMNTPNTWNLDDQARAEYWRLENMAAADANTAAQIIWRDGMVGRDFRPIANEWTNAYVARLRQESFGLPKWILNSQSDEAMREYVKNIGNRYYWSFLRTLLRIMSSGIEQTYMAPLQTAPPLSQQRRYQTRGPRREDEGA